MDEIFYDVANEADIADLINLLSILFGLERDFNADFTKQQKGLELLLKNSATATIQIARSPEGKAIGIVTAQLVISTAQGTASAWIEDMVIDASYRKHGIGKQLLQNTLTWAKTKGATRAQLLIDTANTEALGYYQHLHWESTQLQARRIFL